MSTVFWINIFMSKFDAVYEDLLFSLSEEIKYKDSILVDYVRLLLSALKSQEYFEGSLEKEIERVMDQEGEVKIFAIAKEGLPPLKLEMSSPEKDRFNVTVINAMDEEDQKSFQSNLSTNCIEDVLAYVKEKQLGELKPENAVDEMPPSAGGEAQPGSAGSALPGMGAEAAAAMPAGAPPAPAV
jgi:hypothetical protein